MAISGNQWQSVAISGPSAVHQRQSAVHQGQSAVHQGQSAVHQGQSAVHQGSIRSTRESIYSRGLSSLQSGTISGHPHTCMLERPIITSVLCRSRREQSAVLSPATANPSACCVDDERRRTAATALPLEAVFGRWTREGAKSSLIIWWKNGECGCERARIASLIWSSSNRAGSSGLSST